MCVCMCVCSSLQHVEGFTENISKNTYSSIRVIPCNINVLFHQLGVQKGHSSFSDKVNMTTLPTFHLKYILSLSEGQPPREFTVLRGSLTLQPVCPYFYSIWSPGVSPSEECAAIILGQLFWNGSLSSWGLSLCPVTSSPKGLIFTAKAQLLCSWGIIQSAISGSRTLQKDNRGLEPLPHSATFKSGGLLMSAGIHAYGSLIVPLLPEVSMCWEVGVA